MIKRGWQSLNKTECFATDARASIYRAAEKNCPTEMLATNWHQGWPFNAFRREYKKRDMDYKNKRNPAGCTVVALAHLFYYYKDFPQVQKVFDYLNKLQTSYPMSVYSDRVEVEYQKGKSIDDVKRFAKYIHDNFLYGCLTSQSGSAGIPRENGTLLGKGKHLGLKSVLTQMRNSAKPKDWKTAAELLYEAVVLNKVPALVWLQKEPNNFGVRSEGHFVVIDGCKVDTNLLLKTKSFRDACKFHYHMVNASSTNETDTTGEKYKYYGSDGEQIVSNTLPKMGEKKEFDRVRKIFFYSTDYMANPAIDIPINNNCNIKLEAGRNNQSLYYRITNTGEEKITTTGQTSAQMLMTIKTTDGKEHKKTFYIYLDLKKDDFISNRINFSYAINKIASISIKLEIKDAYGNTCTKSVNVNTKNVKASEIKSKYSDLQFSKV
ncbi:MAG: C10 family peptidase [Salinivirgaceae bacterium]|nr:C10 family peptidase [Salinivirgaceae bacterium]